MDTSSITRSTTAPAPATVKPLTHAPTAELSAPRSVPPAVEVDLSPRTELRRRLSEFENAREMKRAFVNDPDADGLVFRISDGSTGSIVLQIPSEQALKLRAYVEQSARQASGAEPENTIDIKA